MTTPLIQAAKKGDLATIMALLKRGADPSIADAYGQTALHWLCWHWYKSCDFQDKHILADLKQCVLALLAACDVNATDIKGETPLYWLCAQDPVSQNYSKNTIKLMETARTLIAKQLLQHGARVDVKDPDGQNLLDMVMGKSLHPGLARLLIHKKLNTTAHFGKLNEKQATKYIKMSKTLLFQAPESPPLFDEPASSPAIKRQSKGL